MGSQSQDGGEHQEAGGGEVQEDCGP